MGKLINADRVPLTYRGLGAVKGNLRLHVVRASLGLPRTSQYELMTGVGSWGELPVMLGVRLTSKMPGVGDGCRLAIGGLP